MASWLPVDLTMSTEVVCQRWRWREQEVTLAWTSVFLGQILWNAETWRFQWTALENPKAAAWGSPITTITVATHLHLTAACLIYWVLTAFGPWTTRVWTVQVCLYMDFFLIVNIKYYTVCGWLNPWLWNCGYRETVYTQGKLYSDFQLQRGSASQPLYGSRVNYTGEAFQTVFMHYLN